MVKSSLTYLTLHNLIKIKLSQLNMIILLGGNQNTINLYQIVLIQITPKDTRDTLVGIGEPILVEPSFYLAPFKYFSYQQGHSFKKVLSVIYIFYITSRIRVCIGRIKQKEWQEKIA